MLRMVTDGVLRTVMPAFVLQQTADFVVLHVPVGSVGYTRSGVRGGPRGRLLVPGQWDQGYVSRPWAGDDVVMVHRFTECWSTWRWISNNGEWRAGSYINLERLWRVDGDVFDTEDLTLDLVVDETGRVEFKDEDELAWAEEIGWYGKDAVEMIRTTGQEAYRHFSSGGWPLDATWGAWLPGRHREIPQLPQEWEVRSALT